MWDPCFVTVEDTVWFVKHVILLETLFEHVEIFMTSESAAIALANEKGTAARNVTFGCRKQNLSHHPLLQLQ